MDVDDDEQEEPCPSKGSSSECRSREHKKDPIKISTPSQENGTKEVKDPGVKTCPYCGKEFMNGSALGGHMKTHTRKGKLKHGGGGGGGTSSRNLKRKIDELEFGSAKREDAIGNGEEQLLLYTCCQCHKRFQTNKSLHGHMRFHSERSWRGVQQPKISEGDEEVHGDNRLLPEVDLLKDLESWSKTEKRGRISLAGVKSAARGLMKLTHAIPDDFSSSDDGEGDHTPGLKKKDRDKIRQSEVEDPSKIGSSSSVRPVICEKKAANHFRLDCIACHKKFPTLQAFVCHRSVHNKDRGIITHPLKTSPGPDKKIISGNTVKVEQQDYCRYFQAGNPCETYHEKCPKGHVDPP